MSNENPRHNQKNQNETILSVKLSKLLTKLNNLECGKGEIGGDLRARVVINAGELETFSTLKLLRVEYNGNADHVDFICDESKPFRIKHES
jgi:hypothetical protein